MSTQMFLIRLGVCPLKREIDFRIYLVDNAKPVALPVRRMTPKEKKGSVNK